MDQKLPVLFRSFFGDPELWVSTHQVILTNWSRLNQVFVFKRTPETTDRLKQDFRGSYLSGKTRNNGITEFESRA
jgi:hypothetical protein